MIPSLRDWERKSLVYPMNHMVKWFKNKTHQKISNLIPGFRNTTGCKLGWVLEPRIWCKGKSWTICPLGCLNRFIPLGLLTGCKTIRCPGSCGFCTGLRVGEPCCTGINNNRGPVRFTLLGEICGVVTGIWGIFSEKQKNEKLLSEFIFQNTWVKIWD